MQYVMSDRDREEIVGTFSQKINAWNKSKRVEKVEKVIKRKDDKLYVEWKGYNSSFNSWISKKDIIIMSAYFPERKSSAGSWIGFI